MRSLPRIATFPGRSPSINRQWLNPVVLLAFVVGFQLPMQSQGQVRGQMITTGMPLTRVNSSFYERIGIDFGFSFRGTPGNPFGDRARGVFGLGPGGQLQPNLTFSQGGINSAIPPFGQYDPGADATFGYHVRNSQGGYHLGFRMGKGSNRSIVSTTPVLTTTNGYPGSLFQGTANPFVTGIIPIVGAPAPMLPDFSQVQLTHPLEMKLRQLHLEQQAALSGSSAAYAAPLGSNPAESSLGANDSDPGAAYQPASASSTANSGDLSVREIKRLRQQRLQAAADAEQSRVESLVEKAKQAHAQNQLGAARSYLRTAIHYASGNQKQQLQQLMETWNQVP